MARTLQSGRRSQVLVAAPGHPEPQLVYEDSHTLFEAPNWAPDGRGLLLNGDGMLWHLPLEAAAEPAPIAFDGLPPINNDHVLHPDGASILMTAADGHVYRGALTGGPVDRLTPDDGAWHFLHGVSPDGRRVAYVEIVGDGPGRLVVLDPASGAVARPDTGSGHLDGPEFSPDGRWVFYNTESFTDAPGHAQLARIPDAGGEPERLAVSDTVDWFPHLSPDGRWGSYIAFPSGTLGHPADLDVVVHVVDARDWTTSVQRYPVVGGQGTLNVNSWSPASDRLAFVAYPIA